MAQRKKSTAPSTSTTAKSRASSKSKSAKHTEARSTHRPADPMSGYSEQLMHASTPGPHPKRNANDTLLDVDAIDSKRNRVRMWSYKALGLKM